MLKHLQDPGVFGLNLEKGIEVPPFKHFLKITITPLYLF